MLVIPGVSYGEAVCLLVPSQSFINVYPKSTYWTENNTPFILNLESPFFLDASK